MKKILTLITIILLTINVTAQDQQLVDSLQTQLKNHYDAKKTLGSKAPVLYDSTAANILYKLSMAYLEGNTDTAMYYADKCQKLCEQIGYKKGLGYAYTSEGLINSENGNYLDAIELQNKGMNIFESINNKKGLAICYDNIGNNYMFLGNYTEAFKNLLASLKIDDEMGDKKGKGTVYNHLGEVYSKQNNLAEALTNYATALKIHTDNGDKKAMAHTYLNIGQVHMELNDSTEALKNILTALKISEKSGDKSGLAASYSRLGVLYYRIHNFKEALKNHLSSLKIKEEIGNKNGMAESYANIAFIYQKRGNYNEALKNHFAALKLKEELGDKKGMADSYIAIGVNYTKKKNYAEATEYLNKALDISKEIGNIENVRKGYDRLVKLDSTQGRFSDALEHYKLFFAYNDSLINTENNKKTMALQMNYEFDKKQDSIKSVQAKIDFIKEKELQKQKLVRNGFIAGFGIVLLFSLVVYRQRNRIAKEKNRSEELLLNILPSEVAEELKDTGGAKAKSFDEVTVMFTDFKGFTQISEKMSPEELVSEIDYCFKGFDNIISKYGIEKIKTIGDSYMAAGGLPVKNTTHADDVVKAALEINKFMEEHKQQRIKEGKEIFEIRIGIHTGPVVAGIVGIKKFAYDIWGDTVNLASRMESSGEAGKVNISGSTYELVKNDFICTYRGKIQAKNKGEVDMYFLIK